MEYVILGLLLIRGQTIYELKQSFQSGISLFYSASYGSMQSAIKKMLAKEWIAFDQRTESGRNKKIYGITPAGQAAFADWMKGEITSGKLEVTALSKLFFLGHLPQAEREAILQGIIHKISEMERELTQLQEHLQTIACPEEFREIFAYQSKTLEYGIMSHRAALGWFNDLAAQEKKAGQS